MTDCLPRLSKAQAEAMRFFHHDRHRTQGYFRGEVIVDRKQVADALHRLGLTERPYKDDIYGWHAKPTPLGIEVAARLTNSGSPEAGAMSDYLPRSTTPTNHGGNHHA